MAGVPAYIITDLVHNALSITALLNIETDDINFPVANIGDQKLAKSTFLNNQNYPTFPASILFNIVNSPYVNFDSIFIGNHSLTSGATIAVKAGATSSPSTNIGNFTWRSRSMWTPLTAQTVNTYVQMDITEPGNSAVTPIEIGEVVIGPRVNFPRAPKWLIPDQQDNFGITHKTKGGVSWDYELSKQGRLEPTFFFPRSEYAAFKAFSDAVGRTPYVYIPDITQPEAFYVKKERGFNPVPAAAAMDGSRIDHWYNWTLRQELQSEGIVSNQ